MGARRMLYHRRPDGPCPTVWPPTTSCEDGMGAAAPEEVDQENMPFLFRIQPVGPPRGARPRACAVANALHAARPPARRARANCRWRRACSGRRCGSTRCSRRTSCCCARATGAGRFGGCRARRCAPAPPVPPLRPHHPTCAAPSPRRTRRWLGTRSRSRAGWCTRRARARTRTTWTAWCRWWRTACSATRWRRWSGSGAATRMRSCLTRTSGRCWGATSTWSG